MTERRAQSEPGRPSLNRPLDEAKALVAEQLTRGETLPAAKSITEDAEAHRWYEFTEEVLRQICSNNELADEFTGRGKFF